MPGTTTALSCELPEVPRLGLGWDQAGCATQKLVKESVGIVWGGASPHQQLP